MPARVIQSSFSSGEISPELLGRVELEQYHRGLQTCENFIVKPHGGVVNRPGLEFVCEVKDSDTVTRLIPFTFSSTQTYMLEFGHECIRVIADGGLITDAAVSITSTTATNPVRVLATSHSYATGDRVYIDDVSTMTEINSRWFMVTVADANHIDLDDEDGTGYEDGTGGTSERAYVLTTPYGADDLAGLDVTQSADVLTIGHLDWATRELTRTDHNAWTLSEVTFLPSIPRPTTLAAAGGAGDYTYAVTAVSTETGEESRAATVTSAYASPQDLTWDAVTGADAYNVYRDDGGSYRKTGFIGTTPTNQFTDPGDGADDEIEPEWALSPPESASPFGGNAIAITDISTHNPCQITVAAHTYETGDRVYIDDESDEADVNSAWYTITWISGTKFSLDGVDGTGFGWSAGGNVEKFDGNNNCPSVVTYHEQRLVLAGTINDPLKVWLSQSSAFHNMDHSRPARDSDAISFTIAAQQVNLIRALISARDLIILTSGGEWRANGGESRFMTATGGLAVRQETTFGSGTLPALQIGSNVIYYQERGPAVRNLTYSFAEDQWIGIDLSILSRHMFEGYTLAEWTYAQAPYGIIWCIRDDGVLLGMTHQQEHKVIAWHAHSTDGEFESVASVLEGSDDATYVVVRRRIDGTYYRFIERMHSRFTTDVRDSFFVDAGLTLDVPIAIQGITFGSTVVIAAAAHGLEDDDPVDLSDIVGVDELDGATNNADELNNHQYTVDVLTSDTFELLDLDGESIDGSVYAEYLSGGNVRLAVTTIHGADHLNGATASVLANGMHHTDQLVVNGAIELTFPASRVHVGLGYTSTLETLPVEIPSEGGTLQGTRQSVSELIVRVQDSVGIWAGPDEDELYEIKWRTDEAYDQPVRPYTGDTEPLGLAADWDRGATVVVQQLFPLPLAINAIIKEVQLGT